jgi:hypothetical protein
MLERSGPGAGAGATEAKGNIIETARGISRPARWGSRTRRQIDFGRVNHAALCVLPRLLQRWLPGGRIEGAEYVALNPCRADHRPGSFRINTRTGRWADFAVADARGGDVVSLAAYLAGISQIEAAERLAEMFGIEVRRHGR